eukprot:c19735_g1_i1.p1 GENE.c19735_g1_i1~~c19735_g1_i1.p1  ORF type:complete len:356 (-),score=58.08 c19735_g1_i1:124-1191(-)
MQRNVALILAASGVVVLLLFAMSGKSPRTDVPASVAADFDCEAINGERRSCMGRLERAERELQKANSKSDSNCSTPPTGTSAPKSPQIFNSDRVGFPSRTHLWGQPPESCANEFDGCPYVYLDLGTNRGVQIRKVYEPWMFPGAPALPFFSQHFPRDGQTVCTLGVEPNPLLAPLLLDTQEYLWRTRGARARVLTNTGIGAVAEPAKVIVAFENDVSAAHAWWGAFVVPASDPRHGIPIEIAAASALFKAVASRNLTGAPLLEGRKPVVLVKLDIEGMECTLMDTFIAANDKSLCALDVYMVECHCGDACGPLGDRVTKFCPNIAWIWTDDETFGQQPLPTTGPPNQYHTNVCKK